MNSVAEDTITSRRTGGRHTYIPGFDGLRAMAVGLVLVAHAGYDDIVPGGLGVTIFFAISGFLITTLLLQEQDETESIDLKQFYIRRFLRLYPELLVFIAISIALIPVFKWQVNLAEIFAVITYFMNYYYVFGSQYPNSQSVPWRQIWSLAIEEHFYLVFPFIVSVCAKRRDILKIAIYAAIILPLIWRIVAYYILDMPWQYNYVATEARIDSIAWGCLLALVLHERRKLYKPESTAFYIHPISVVIGLGMLIFSLIYRSEEFRWTWRFSIQGIAIFLIIANVLFDPYWRQLVKLLELSLIRYLGRISYGLYLYHMLLNVILAQVLSQKSWAFLPASLFLSIAVATISYQLLEVPLKPLRRKFGSHVR